MDTLDDDNADVDANHDGSEDDDDDDESDDELSVSVLPPAVPCRSLRPPPVQLHSQYSALAEAWGVLPIQCSGMVLIQNENGVNHVKPQTLPNAFPPAAEVFSGRTFLSSCNPAACASVRPSPDRSSDILLSCVCPSCGHSVPHVGALFWKHLYGCDRDMYHGAVGAPPPPVSSPQSQETEQPPPPPPPQQPTPIPLLSPLQRWQRGKELSRDLPAKRPHPDSGVVRAQEEARKRLARHERHLRSLLYDEPPEDHGEQSTREKREATTQAQVQAQVDETANEDSAAYMRKREAVVCRAQSNLDDLLERLGSLGSEQEVRARMSDFSRRWNALLRSEHSETALADYRQRFPGCDQPPSADTTHVDPDPTPQEQLLFATL